MHVIKRDGRHEKVHFDKITSRIKKLCYKLNEEYVDPVVVAQKVCLGVYKGVTTSELDELAAETAAHLTSKHPDYGLLAARIAVSNLHKATKKVFTDVVTELYTYVEPRSGKAAPLIAPEVYTFIMAHKEQLNSAIVYDRDYQYDYFGFKTMERSYLLRLKGKIVERPQHMLMRVSCGIHSDDIDACIETYNLLSEKWFTHASPTLFNSGTPKPQLSSCFLLTMADDSIEGIYDTLKQCAQISKHAGGIGLSVHNIRAAGSYIRGTNGTSNGLVPMLRVFNNTARYVDQGGGKRKGSFAIYLEPWHADILAFLDLKKNHGSEEYRARDLFFGLWVPDLFMKRVEENKTWSLFCPNEAVGLADAYGEKFTTLYEGYEKAGKARKTVQARTIWQAILEAQTETGTPYMLYKDACNMKSNQKNLGTIRSSNLCTEIIEYSSPDEIAVCNLASIALPMFVTGDTFDHKKLFEVTKVATRNLNKIIDVNHYPVEAARKSNMRHRPIGIGCQGLADAFILLRMPFDSPAAQQLNKEIFETMYFAAVTASCELAQKLGPYETFKGSPMSEGIFQFDMWKDVKLSGRYDWAALKAKVIQHGVRNSLLLAPMPTASTSQILGNNEAFEPYTSNIYVRRTLAGEFVCVSRHLLNDLIKRGLWTPELRNRLIAHNGSVQHLDEVPKDLKELYKTVWEIKIKDLIDMAADRGAFIDQSQSFNVHMTDVNFGKLTSMHFYAWKKGLKTGMYYLRSQAAADAIKFTVDAQLLRQTSVDAKVAPATPSTPVLGATDPKTGFFEKRVGEYKADVKGLDMKTPQKLSPPGSSNGAAAAASAGKATPTTPSSSSRINSPNPLDSSDDENGNTSGAAEATPQKFTQIAGASVNVTTPTAVSNKSFTTPATATTTATALTPTPIRVPGQAASPVPTPMKEKATAVAAAINAAATPTAATATATATSPAPAPTAPAAKGGKPEKTEEEIEAWRRKRALEAAILNKEDSEGCISCGS